MKEMNFRWVKSMKYKRIVFAGDSITDADHLWDPGEDGLGHGYVHMISEELHNTVKPEQMPVIINSGFNGYRAEDLLRRWNTVCLQKKPDLVTLLVGVNEAGAAMEGMVTTPEQFYRTYERLVREVLEETGADMILMEPFLFRYPAYLLNWRTYLQTLQPVIEEIAGKYGLPLIRLDRPLNDLAEKVGVNRITIDGIHLTEQGNRFLMKQWLNCFSGMY